MERVGWVASGLEGLPTWGLLPAQHRERLPVRRCTQTHNFELLHRDVDAMIVRQRQPATARRRRCRPAVLQEHLAPDGARGVAPRGAGQVKGQPVAHALGQIHLVPAIPAGKAMAGGNRELHRECQGLLQEQLR